MPSSLISCPFRTQAEANFLADKMACLVRVAANQSDLPAQTDVNNTDGDDGCSHGGFWNSQSNGSDPFNVTCGAAAGPVESHIPYVGHHPEPTPEPADTWETWKCGLHEMERFSLFVDLGLLIQEAQAMDLPNRELDLARSAKAAAKARDRSRALDLFHSSEGHNRRLGGAAVERAGTAEAAPELLLNASGDPAGVCGGCFKATNATATHGASCAAAVARACPSRSPGAAAAPPTLHEYGFCPLFDTDTRQNKNTSSSLNREQTLAVDAWHSGHCTRDRWVSQWTTATDTFGCVQCAAPSWLVDSSWSAAACMHFCQGGEVVSMLQAAVDSSDNAVGLPFGVVVDGISSAHTQHSGAALGGTRQQTLAAVHAMSLASNDVLAVMHLHLCHPPTWNSSINGSYASYKGSARGDNQGTHGGSYRGSDRIANPLVPSPAPTGHQGRGQLEALWSANQTNSTPPPPDADTAMDWAEQFSCSLPKMKEKGKMGDLLGQIIIPELGVMTWGMTSEILCPDASVYADPDASPPPKTPPHPPPTPPPPPPPLVTGLPSPAAGPASKPAAGPAVGPAEGPAAGPGAEDNSRTHAFGGADFSEAEENEHSFPLFKGTPLRLNATRDGKLLDADPQEPYTNAYSPAEANNSDYRKDYQHTVFDTAPLQTRERIALGVGVAVVVLATLLAVWQVARYWRSHRLVGADADEVYVPYTPPDRGASISKDQVRQLEAEAAQLQGELAAHGGGAAAGGAAQDAARVREAEPQVRAEDVATWRRVEAWFRRVF